MRGALLCGILLVPWTVVSAETVAEKNMAVLKQVKDMKGAIVVFADGTKIKVAKWEVTDKTFHATDVFDKEHDLLKREIQQVIPPPTAAEKARAQAEKKAREDIKEFQNKINADVQREALRWQNMPVTMKPASSIMTWRFSPAENGRAVMWKISIGEGIVKYKTYKVYIYNAENHRLAEGFTIVKDMSRNSSMEDSCVVDPSQVSRIEVIQDLNL